ncbi:hypothetical protein, partial [Lapillicoccus sp.]|uniref:hypothetical protein n=1 Tax=Lapillicoccus sp. TaxID=1909287 RepID=UPI002F9427C3
MAGAAPLERALGSGAVEFGHGAHYAVRDNTGRRNLGGAACRTAPPPGTGHIGYVFTRLADAAKPYAGTPREPSR